MNNSKGFYKQNLSNSKGGHRVIMALGSNSCQQECMAEALRLIGKIVNCRTRTRMVWTEPIGIKSGMFLNCLLAGETMLGLDDLNCAVKNIEKQCGRTADAKISGRICMDIDILEYDGVRHHDDDWERAYIKQLMEEI